MIGASRVRMFVGSDALSDAAVESLAPQRNLRCQHEAGPVPSTGNRRGILAVLSLRRVRGGVMTEKLHIMDTERRDSRLVVTLVVKPDGRSLRFYRWQDPCADDKRSLALDETHGFSSSGCE